MKNLYFRLKTHKNSIIFVTFFSLLFMNFTSFAPSSWVHFANASKYLVAKKSPYNTIIFDLSGVVFKTNSNLKLKLISQTVWNNPALLWYLLSIDAKKEYFKTLDTISGTNTSVQMYDNDQPLPYIFADWQTSAKTNQDCCQLAHQAIDQSEHPQAVQNLLKNIATFHFSPELLCSSQEPIDDMVALIKILKESNEYKLYVLSNWDRESFDQMQKKHAAIFELFDGVMISGQEGMIKPSQDFFKNLLKKYKINPETAVFIDDQKTNITTGESLGLKTIHCRSTKSVTAQLESFQILTKESNVC